LSVAAQLQLQGATVTVTDPEALANAKQRFPELSYEPDTKTAIDRAHVLVLLTEWKEYRELDPAAVANQVTEKKILDGRNVLDPVAWRDVGWTFKGIGRP
jgi:UDPglucose 6-dehydrogenase